MQQRTSRHPVPSSILWLFTAARLAGAATYFVAPGGMDSNAGTEAQPWGALRKAAAAVKPGDTVRIKAGSYFVGPTWTVNRAGRAESPITYQAHGVGSTYGVGFHAGKPGNRVMNNILQDAKSFVIWPAESLPQTLDHNLYHNASAAPRWERDGVTHRTFAAYQEAGGETHSLHADPRLVDARLRAGSPAIDAGMTLREVSADFDGVARPQGSASDIGAHEFKPDTK